MLCDTGKLRSADAKVCSITCFEYALDDQIYFDVDGQLKNEFASVTEFVSVRATIAQRKITKFLKSHENTQHALQNARWQQTPMLTMPVPGNQMYVYHLNNNEKVFCPIKMTLAKCNVCTGTTVSADTYLISYLFLIVNTRQCNP